MTMRQPDLHPTVNLTVAQSVLTDTASQRRRTGRALTTTSEGRQVCGSGGNTDGTLRSALTNQPAPPP